MQRLAESLKLSSGEAVPRFFEELSASLGLPARLRDLGVPWDEVEACTQAAFEDHCGATNPRALTMETCRELLRASY